MLALQDDLLGSFTPTHRLVPLDIAYTDVDDALAIAEGVGIELEPHQSGFLHDGLGRRVMPDKTTRWAGFEVAEELARQNGKSVGFEVRSLAGLFVFKEQRIVYSAHKGETALGAFQRMEELIDSDSELRALVRDMPRATGREAIRLTTGQQMKFRTRTSGGGRGLFGDLVIVDEVQDATDDHLAALMPLMSAQTVKGDPQLWYGGSAGTRKSTVLGRLVRRMMAELERREKGLDPVELRLVMSRWAADLDVDDPADPEVWARTNPMLGRRISVEYVGIEFRQMNGAIDPTRFAAERLGVGDYPREENEDWVIARRRWEAGEDRDSEIVGDVVFSVEVKQDRGMASIVSAGWRADGDKHIENIATELGTAWTIVELTRLTTVHPNLGVIIDPGSPANSLIGPLRDAGVKVILLKTMDVTQAFGSFYDAFANVDGDGKPKPTIHHTGGLVLTAALAGSDTRLVQGSTTWKRAVSDDVASIIAATWAAHGLDMLRERTPPAAPSRRRANQFASAAEKRPRPQGRGGGAFDPRSSSF